MQPIAAPRHDLAFYAALAALVGTGFYLAASYAAWICIPFADTCTYLDPWRNLLDGRGLVTRFNIVWGWSGGLSHPGLGYYSPLYGLTLGLLWKIFADPRLLAVLTTALPCAINAVLLAVLVRPAFGRLVALLSAAGYFLLPSTTISSMLITAEHPTVTWCLVLLLLVQRLVPRSPRYWLAIGLLAGFGYLFRVQMLGAAPALLLGLFLTQEGQWRVRLRASRQPAILLLAGVALVVVPFNVICLVKTGSAYPEYPSLAKNWALATEYGGEFVEGSPAVKPDPKGQPNAGQCLGIGAKNCQTLFIAAAGELGLLILALLPAMLGLNRAQFRDAIYLLCMGSTFWLMYASAYYWLDLSDQASTPARYALHIAAYWYPLAVFGLANVIYRIPLRPQARVAAVLIAWVVVSLPHAWAFYNSRAVLSNMRAPRVAGMQQMMATCQKMTGPDDLIGVASGGLHICASMFLERPVVPLPSGDLNTPEHFKRFIEIFRPALIIPGHCESAHRVMPTLTEYEARGVPAVNGRGLENIYVRRHGLSSHAAAGGT